MSSRPLRVVSLAAAAASATVWLAACGSAGTTPAATTTPTNPTTSTSSPATAPTQTQSPQTQPPATSTPAVTTTPGLAACSGSSLRITVDASLANGAAGSVYYPLNFVNTSAATCQMYGFPGVSFVTSGDATCQQIGAAALRAGAFTKVSVRLAPGGTAHAWLKVAVAQNYPSATCGPVTAHWLRVYPPGSTVAGYAGYTFSACSRTGAPLLTVLPVRLGKGAANVTP
jgi:hypothetical protein